MPTTRNNRRLHSRIGHVGPLDKLAGREKETLAESDRVFKEARKKQAEARQQNSKQEKKSVFSK